MKQGKVKWYNKEKGYGFIEAEGEKDYFVNKYNIEDKDYLEEGDRVEFEEKIIKEKGREAIKVKKITRDYNDIVNKGYTLRDVNKAEDFIEDLIYTYQLIRNKKLSKGIYFSYEEICYLMDLLLTELVRETDILENKKKYNYSTEIVEEKLKTIKNIIRKIEGDED